MWYVLYVRERSSAKVEEYDSFRRELHLQKHAKSGVPYTKRRIYIYIYVYMYQM